MIRKKKDNLEYRIYENRAIMGAAAADDAARIINKLLETQIEVNIIFAAAPSQNELLTALRTKNVDWSRVNAFHMDEYAALSEDAPQGFFNFLNNLIFSRLPFKSVNRIYGDDVKRSCVSYSFLLKAHPCDLCCMGIGENGHIAFNDPHEADFNDTALIKPVTLDETCRMQQVNDGCFADISLVPKTALTLTIPALFSAKHIICVVPAETKANAVKRTIEGEINEECPASILRRHEDAVLYLEPNSAKLL